MPEIEGPGENAVPERSDVAEEIVRRAPQDLVFVMRFLGESQYRMQSETDQRNGEDRSDRRATCGEQTGKK